MKLHLIFLICILYFQKQIVQAISFRGGDSLDLFEQCDKFSGCSKSVQCKIDFEHCIKCEELQYSYWSKQGDKNNAKYECYRDCLEENKTQENKQELLPEVHDYMHCLKFKISNLPDFQKHKKFFAPRINLIAQILLKKGWTQITNNTDPSWDLKWVYYYKHINYSENRTDQIGSKTQNFQRYIGDKIGLINTLRRYDQNSNFKINSTKFLPASYIIDYSNMDKQEEEEQLFASEEEYWIIKNPEGKGGEGITIKKTMDDVKSFIRYSKEKIYNETLRQQQLEKDGEAVPDNKLEEKVPVPSANVTDNNQAVIQRYIANPSLLSGKKYDIRSFVLIACTKPLVLLYRPGFFGKSYEDFDLEIEPFDDTAKIKHLTNTKQQSKHENWTGKNKGLHRNEIVTGFKNLKKQYKLKDQQITDIKRQLQYIAAYTYLAAFDNEEYTRNPFEFHFTAIDYMLDDENNAYLLEANSDPLIRLGFGKANTAQPVITGLDIILQILQIKDIDERYRLLKNIYKYFDLSGWQILYNEASGYNVLDSII